MKTFVDASVEKRCPLCGGPNNCAMVQSPGDAPACWCREVRMSRVALERAIATPGVCLCPSCAAGELPPG